MQKSLIALFLWLLIFSKDTVDAQMFNKSLNEIKHAVISKKQNADALKNLDAAQNIAMSNFTEGNYTSSDGIMTIQLKKQGNNLVVVDPYTTSVYTPVSENTYAFTSPKTGTVFMVQIIDNTTIKTYKKGYENQSTLFSFSGDSEKGATREENKKYFAIAHKYKGMMQSDSKNAQLWSFCAAAANARASLNESGYKDYARKASLSLKQIIVNRVKCPCEDAIDPIVWNSAE